MCEDAPPRSGRPRRSADDAEPSPHGARSHPLWFAGPNGRPLFGWYHPAAGARARTGVVLANPFGHEAMSAHRSYAYLATQLAEAGIAALRFDYEGTGDSAGDPDEPGRLQAWTQSIACARRALVEQSGIENVVVFGTRLGALLALLDAAEDPPDGLILFAPPASGRAWVREMRALQLVRNAGQEGEPAVLGFALNETTAGELSKVSLKPARAPCRFALVIPRDDLPGGAAELDSHLGGLGVQSTLSTTPGYAAMMHDDPIKAVVPAQVLEGVVAWVRAKLAGGSSPPLERPPRSTATIERQTIALPSPEVREEAVTFQGVFGILSEPVTAGPRAATAILLFNIGANHHVGSNGMYVAIARHLAHLGFRVLRLDFTGIGDSVVPRGGHENEVYAQRFFAEARAGMDFLESRGVSRFVLAGLCSGAYVAYHTAVADPRVSGIVLINLLTFHWQEGDSLEVRTRNSTKSTLFYRRALLKPETWKRVVQGEVNTRVVARALWTSVSRRVHREAVALSSKVLGSLTEATDIGRGFVQLDTRGVRSLLIYGANDGGIDVIEEHLGPGARDMSGRPGFEMVVIDGPDHTFTPLWSQRKLLELISNHLMSTHPAAREAGRG